MAILIWFSYLARYLLPQGPGIISPEPVNSMRLHGACHPEVVIKDLDYQPTVWANHSIWLNALKSDLPIAISLKMGIQDRFQKAKDSKAVKILGFIKFWLQQVALTAIDIVLDIKQASEFYK